jgi:DNA ligase-1
MRQFADLLLALDATNSTQAKIQAIVDYLSRVPARDAAWAVFLLGGGKATQAVPTRLLREAAIQASGVAPWLFEECYAAVGDLAETIALLVARQRPDDGSEEALSVWMDERLPALRGAEPECVRQTLCEVWQGLDATGVFALNKLITGGLRLGVSRQIVARALARLSGLDDKRIAQRLMGYTDRRRRPSADDFKALIAPEHEADAPGGSARGDPYPFFLAHALVGPPEALGPAEAWCAEWKWDGIRAQWVARAGQAWLWSRGEELVSDRFPEVMAALRDGGLGAAGSLVLDGELLAWDGERDGPRDFALLQRRLQRKQVSAAVLRELPVRFVAYDLLEENGQDLRAWPFHARRARLEALAGQHGLAVSPMLAAVSWSSWATLRQQAREHRAEGLMLKYRDSVYGVGRTRSAGAGWWKWKLDPMSVDAVLVYAQRGHGRRASLYTDYTFALWDRPADQPGERRLLPFAKAYSGLTDAEIRAVDAQLRKTTRESFGPVRSVEPTLVFELGFEGISASPRHKSGVAVRFPRILRWRTDKTPEQADHLGLLHALIDSASTHGR